MRLPEGLLPGAYTPFTDDHKLNPKVLADQLQHVSKGAGGLHGPAGHSEFASLTFDEWKVWTDVLIDLAKKAKIPSWSFFGTESFEKTLPYAEYARKAGADGFYVMAPYFNLYGQEAAFQYYRDLAKEFSDMPIVFYPSLQTGNRFEPATVARIAELPNVVGMKLNGDYTYDQVSKIILLTRDNKTFRPVTGGLNVLYPLMSNVDIKASCSPFSNFAHEWSLNLWKAYGERNWPELEKWQRKIGRISAVLNVAGDRHVGARAGIEAVGMAGR
jgi:dihydrodipicolinate synthase/N-acetylneuraminate lyase